MMDSQDQTPIEEQNVTPISEQETETVENVVEEQPVAEQEPVLDAPAVESEAQEPERKQYETKQEVLERVRELAHGDEAPQKDEVDYLKTCFYKLHIAEREAQLKAYIDGGGDPEQYQITPDQTEEAFKAEMVVVREKRQQLFRQQEQEKLDNLEKKLAIIEKIKSMVTSPEEANKSYKDFKTLQYFSSVNQTIATGDSNHNEFFFGSTHTASFPRVHAGWSPQSSSIVVPSGRM